MTIPTFNIGLPAIPPLQALPSLPIRQCWMDPETGKRYWAVESPDEMVVGTWYCCQRKDAADENLWSIDMLCDTPTWADDCNFIDWTWRESSPMRPGKPPATSKLVDKTYSKGRDGVTLGPSGLAWL